MGTSVATGTLSCSDKDDQEEEDTCGVCFEQFEKLSAAAVLRGCGHRLCTGCARGVVRQGCGEAAAAEAAPAPPSCPFCRRVIVGFVGV
jgi:hypothetical protein